MTALQKAERYVFRLTPAEKAQMLQWIFRDIGNAFPGIESRPGICAGSFSRHVGRGYFALISNRRNRTADQGKSGINRQITASICL